MVSLSTEDKQAGLCFLAPFTAYCSVGISVNLKFLPKCVIIHHEGLCFNFQQLDLPTFRPTLYCSPCWSTVMMPETTEMEERGQKARICTLAVWLFWLIYIFLCNSCVCVCA